MKHWEFQCSRRAFLDFADEFSEKFYKKEYRNKSIVEINDFIDKFLKKHFTDYHDDEN